MQKQAKEAARKADEESAEEGEEEEIEEESEEESEEEGVQKKPGAAVLKTPAGKVVTRMDRMKLRQWENFKEQGDLGPEAIKAFEKANHKGKREIVDGTVVRLGDGSYTLNLQNRALQLFITKTRDITTGTQGVGVIKQVAEAMCGGPAKLQEAIDDGNAWVATNERGQQRYWIDQEVASDLQRVQDTQKIEGAMKLNADQWRH